MAGDGPTTAGSIVGKLKLDTSDWDAKIAAADAAARKLGSVDPSIRIDVDDNGAISKMAAVDAAAKALGTTEDRTSQQTQNLGNSAGGVSSRMALIAGAIAALIPLLGPLTGAAVGLSGALAGLGGAALLGVLGVVQAMKQGTAVGEQYSGGLQLLKSDLDQLARTSATQLLSAFHSSVQMINDDMPALNSQLSWFSGQLGIIGTTTLRAVLSAIQTLNPLFIQATNYVKQLAQGFASWTENGGLSKFASFAQATFPQVTAAIGSLSRAALNLVEALAPIGTVMLNILTAAGNVISFLTSMGPAFSIIGGAALAAFGAFKLWGLVGPIISAVTTALEAAAGGATAFGIAIDAASGPIGWVIAGIGALTAAFAIGTAATQKNTDATAEYTSALQTSNGAIDENIRKTVAKQLSDSGALQTAKQYHLQLSTVTDAVLGNKDAMQQVTDATNKYGQELHTTTGASGQMGAQYKALSGKAKDFLDTVNGQTGSLKDSVQAFRDQQSASEASKNAVNDLSGAEDKARAATDKFAQALAGLGNVNLSAEQANIQYQQSLADLNAAVQKNGKNLDVTTQAGRDNMSALDGIASSATALISAEAKQGASEGQLQTDMGNSRQAFINAAEAAGATAQQAQDLADKYGLIPGNVSTAYSTSGADDAVEKANAVATAVDAIKTSITIRVQAILDNSTNANIGFGLGDGHAAGGRIGKGMAGGGFSGAVAGLGNAFNDQAGLFPLADGEFVASNRFKQAQTYMGALEAINAGASPLVVAANALKAGGGYRGSGGQSVVHNHYTTNQFTVVANDPNELMQKVSMKQNETGRV